MIEKNAICPIMTAILEYIQTCNFMWMLNEGAYLNILLTYSVFDNNQQNIIIGFYIIGWGTSLNQLYLIIISFINSTLIS